MSSAKGKQIGRVFGERYVVTVTTGIKDASIHRKLTQLLEDYCRSGVADLIELYTTLGGSTRDEKYCRTPAEIDYSRVYKPRLARVWESSDTRSSSVISIVFIFR